MGQTVLANRVLKQVPLVIFDKEFPTDLVLFKMNILMSLIKKCKKIGLESKHYTKIKEKIKDHDIVFLIRGPNLIIRLLHFTSYGS